MYIFTDELRLGKLNPKKWKIKNQLEVGNENTCLSPFPRVYI